MHKLNSLMQYFLESSPSVNITYKHKAHISEVCLMGKKFKDNYSWGSVSHELPV